MGRKKPEWLDENVEKLQALCEEKGYEIAKLDRYHYRVLGAVSIVDIWPSRMKYHVMSVEGVIDAKARYLQMDQQFNREQVLSLLEKGRI